ncbi:NAD(P)/FAD-dependent oxidoreductase [Muricoccus radiodurans]|uniref:NAD(P)/FAD-dependent oxidoreductase n=1 Tax=Muricoccus radiodurans TaxID=2231721 RepID=UPI003CEEEE9F
MGLAAAHHALKRGWRVTVLEAGPKPGGMAAHFDLGGFSVERYYHFVCRSDAATFALMEELDIGNRMRWVPTSMGNFVSGALHRWGDPVALLRAPFLTPVEKLRYGLFAFAATKRRVPGKLEHLNARDWITGWCGRGVWDKLWAPLFDLKFHELSDNISASWIWTRLKRVGTSRRSLMQEELGYIDGGSETLVTALVSSIERQGGEVRLSCPAGRVLVEGGRAAGVLTTDGELVPADAVISTVPTPLIPRLVPELPNLAEYEGIQNIGVICVALRLSHPVSPYFWVNISDPRIGYPGFVEYSNLRPAPDGDAVVYVPFYMPHTHPRWGMSDEVVRDEAMAGLALVNPAVTAATLRAWHVGRLRHAQPVCPPGFARAIPRVQTAIAGLQIADTCFYYPEDRGISESVRLGREMAEVLPAVASREDNAA